MKRNIILSILLVLAAIPTFGMQQSIPLWFDKSTQGGMLPAELYHELIKYLLHNKPAYNYWYFKCLEKMGWACKTFKIKNNLQALVYDAPNNSFFSGLDPIDNEMLREPLFVYSILASFAYDAPNNRLFTGLRDDTIKIWDLNNNNIRLRTLVGHTDWICRLVYDPVTNRLFSGSYDNTIKIWDLNKNICVRTLTGHTNAVLSLLCDPVKNLLFSGSWDRTIKIWDLNNNTCLCTLTGHTGWVCSLVRNPLNNCLFSGSRDGTIKMWNLNNNTLLCTLHGHIGSVWGLVLDPAKNLLFSGSLDGTIKIWDLNNNTCHTLTGHSNSVCNLTYDPANNLLFSGSREWGAIKIWDLNDLNKITCLCTLMTGMMGCPIPSLIHDPINNLLFSGSQNGTIKIWNFCENEKLKRSLTSSVDTAQLLHYAYENQIIDLRADDRFSHAFYALPELVQDAIKENRKVIDNADRCTIS